MAKSLRLLTLDDLYSFCIKNNFTNYNSKSNSNTSVVVQSPGFFETSEESFQGMMPVKLKACHTLRNRNRSFISDENMIKALPSLKNKFILGNIIQLKDGTFDFHAHDFIVKDEDTIEYIERGIGIVPESCNAHLEYDDVNEKNYVVADGFIHEDYGNKAAEIIRRKGTVKVSVEIVINEFSFNTKEKVLEITDFYFNGVTCLGSEYDGTEIGEGMEGSNLTIKDFSSENNGFKTKYEEQMFDLLGKLNDTLSNFNIKAIEKGGKCMTKFEELLDMYKISVEDVTFETEGLSDEELDSKFKEVFGESEEDKKDDEKDDEKDEDVKKEDMSDSKDSNSKYIVRSLNESGNLEVKFEISHDDIRMALYNLVSATYETEDVYVYIREVYDSTFIMEEWCGSLYRQSYSKKDDVVSLLGEREVVYETYVTEEEKAELESKKAQYDSIVEELNSYKNLESNKEKEAILNSEDYSQIAEEDSFKELCKNIGDYSKEEITVKADLLLAGFVKSGNFSVKDKSKDNKIGFSFEKTEEVKPYGNLFDNVKTNKKIK